MIIYYINLLSETEITIIVLTSILLITIPSIFGIIENKKIQKKAKQERKEIAEKIKKEMR